MDFTYEPGRLYAADENGALVAEVLFPTRNGVAVITHTFVDASLRGQGVADKLTAAAAKRIRADGLKARAVCSYAARWFADHPEESDLLADRENT